MKEKIKKNFFLLISILVLLLIPAAFVIAANYKSFLVERVFGYDKLLITDGFSQYIISYGFGCSSFDFFEGKTIWIDTYFSPSFFNTILAKGIFDTKTCDITNSKEVNLKQYFVISVIDNKDEIIVEDKYRDKYLVEYGIGCGLSMWRYEGKYIDIDIGGSFLDGISDRIYLFDPDKDCKVWDAQKLSSDQWRESPLYTTQCPANSTLTGNTCVCNEGYIASGSICITYTQNCQLKYGINSYGDKDYCHCSPGYEFNSEKTACIKSIICSSNSTRVNNVCVCNEGYVWGTSGCITYTQNCQSKYGPNSYGDKQNCYCSAGYEWDVSQTTCIKSVICPLNSTKINNACMCNEGHIMKNNQCITYTEDCIQHFGQNVYGTKGSDGNSLCNCNEGYEWNISRTACTKKEMPERKEEITKPIQEQQIQHQEEKKEKSVAILEDEKEISDEIQEVLDAETKEETQELQEPQEQKQEAEKGSPTFLASIFNAIKSFFSKVFSWF